MCRCMCLLFVLGFLTIGGQQMWAQGHDIEVNALLTPTPGVTLNLGFATSFEAVILNLGPGASPYSLIEFRVDDQNGTPVFGPEIVFVPGLAVGEAANVQSIDSWTPVSLGTYTVSVTSLLADNNAANDNLSTAINTQEVLISQQSAIDIVTTSVISVSPYVNDIVAFLYNSTVNAVQPIGTVVKDYEESFTNTFDAKYYFFWLDNKQDEEWMHETSFVFVNAWTGAYTTIDAMSWPIVNGSEITSFTYLGNHNPDKVWGEYRPHNSETVTYTPVPRQPNNTWALIVTGKNLDGAGERKARKNDIARVQTYLNNNDKGPKIPDDHIVTASGGANASGATKQDVCKALDTMKNCDKLYFFYLGHGSRNGYPVLKELPKMTWNDLACKLLDNDAKEVCITIEACFAGTAVEPMQTKCKDLGQGQTKKLKGDITVSSSASEETKRIDKCGTPFYKGLDSCSRDANADANKDGKITVKEAILWAASTDFCVGDRNPEWHSLNDNSSVTVVSADCRSFKNSKTRGGTLEWFYYSTCYLTQTEVEVEGGEDEGEGEGEVETEIKEESTWVTRVYVYSKNQPHRPGRKVDIKCDGVKVGCLGPGQTIPKGKRVCLLNIPKNCKKITVVPSTVGTRKRENQDHTASLAEPRVDYISRTKTYTKGQLIYFSFPVDAATGNEIEAEVEAVPGWDISISPTSMTKSDLVNPEYVTIRGTVPTTASCGASFTACVVDTTEKDTSKITIDALLYSSMAGGIAGGDDLSYKEIDCNGAIDIASSTASIKRCTVHLTQTSACVVASGASLNVTTSLIAPRLNVNYSFDIFGSINWSSATLIRPDNGMALHAADGQIVSAAVHESQGHGLQLIGNQSQLTLDGLYVTSATGHGLYFDHATNCQIQDVQIAASGQQDVFVTNASVVWLLNCTYDDQKEVLSANSLLFRQWTTSFLILNADGNPATGATVNIYNAGSSLVSTASVDADGFIPNMNLLEYLRIGAQKYLQTPHTVEVIYNNSTTSVQHTADAMLVPTITLPSSLVTDVKQPGRSTSTWGVSIHPNPVRTETNVEIVIPLSDKLLVRIVDIRGNEVARLHDAYSAAGRHRFRWDASVAAGGSYFCLVQYGSATLARRIQLVR